MMRTFETGATRDDDKEKIDPEGFLSPQAIEAFCQYMKKHQTQADGSRRTSDNWQKGIPIEQYIKSAFRHFLAVWKGHRAGAVSLDDLCALMFNVQGMIHEEVKRGQGTPRKDFSEAKVGGRVWSKTDGWGKIIGVDRGTRSNPLMVCFPSPTNDSMRLVRTFGNDGRRFITDLYPSLFWEEQS